MTRTLLAMMVFFCAQNTTWAKEAGDKRPENTLFDRPIADTDRRLVVVQGPDIDMSLFDFWKGPVVDQRGKSYEIRVEIRATGKPPQVIACCIHSENKLTPLVEQRFSVLEARVEPGVIILGISEGTTLAVWKINVFGSPPSEWMHFKDRWNRYAAPYALNAKVVAMEFGRTADGRLTVEIINKARPAPYEHTLYEQPNKNDPQFKRVRQWEE